MLFRSYYYIESVNYLKKYFQLIKDLLYLKRLNATINIDQARALILILLHIVLCVINFETINLIRVTMVNEDGGRDYLDLKVNGLDFYYAKTISIGHSSK